MYGLNEIVTMNEVECVKRHSEHEQRINEWANSPVLCVAMAKALGEHGFKVLRVFPVNK